MDKETLIRLATPAAIVLLALSIFSAPRITRADLYGGETFYIKHLNSCAD